MKYSIILLWCLTLGTNIFAQKPSSSILIDCEKSHKIAKVVFFRPFKLVGSAVGFELFWGDSLFTKMNSKSFYVAELPAGRNRFTSSTYTLKFIKKNKSSINLNLEGGKIYFIKCESKPFSQGITEPNHTLLFKLLNEKEIKHSLKKKFLRKRLKEKLYSDFYNLI